MVFNVLIDQDGSRQALPHPRKTRLLFLSTLRIASSSHAAVTTSGNFQTGTPVATITIDAPLQFTATSAMSWRTVVFDEWISTGTAASWADATVGQQLSYSITRGGVTGPLTTIPISFLQDRWHQNLFALTPNDGFMVMTSAVALNAGDVVTLLPQSWTFQPPYDANFDQPPAVVTTNLHLMSEDSQTLSGAGITVPEPSAAMLGSLALIPLLRRRRGDDRRARPYLRPKA